MAWLFVPVPECWTKDYGPDVNFSTYHTEPSVTSKGKPLRPLRLLHAWRTERWMKRLSGLILHPSWARNGAEKWIASLPVSRASRTVSPANAKVWPTSDGYGRTSSASFAKRMLGFAGWRTSPDLFQPEGLPHACTTFPRSGSMLNGECWERETLARRTNGSDCLFWHTVTASETTGPGLRGGRITDLRTTATQWMTPTTPSGGRTMSKETMLAKGKTASGKRQVALEHQATYWGTPTARDHKDGATTLENMPTNKLLGREVLAFSRPDKMTHAGPTSSIDIHTSRRRLNPAFAAWLMGWPWWWTNPAQINCARSEMALYRCKLQQHLCFLLGEQG